jgi:hypothetical protein
MIFVTALTLSRLERPFRRQCHQSNDSPRLSTCKARQRGSGCRNVRPQSINVPPTPALRCAWMCKCREGRICVYSDTLVVSREATSMAESGARALYQPSPIVLIDNRQGAFVAICRTVHNGTTGSRKSPAARIVRQNRNCLIMIRPRTCLLIYTAKDTCR